VGVGGVGPLPSLLFVGRLWRPTSPEELLKLLRGEGIN